MAKHSATGDEEFPFVIIGAPPRMSIGVAGEFFDAAVSQTDAIDYMNSVRAMPEYRGWTFIVRDWQTVMPRYVRGFRTDDGRVRYVGTGSARNTHVHNPHPAIC